MEIIISPDSSSWAELFRRPSFEQADLEATVLSVIDEVRRVGDKALKEFIGHFEGRMPNELLLPRELIDGSAYKVDAQTRGAIDQAADNIKRFHEAQRSDSVLVETMPGVRCWWRDLPIARVGLYIPGGTAPLISTALMLGIPAQIAGCSEIIACTPPSANNEISPALLYAAKVAGITELYAMGGAQAIAALAYGTESIRAVDKIFGPGNQYVTCAKMMVNRAGIAIDMPAGPSEVAIVADSSAPPSWVAADMLSQAEHGSDSQVVLIAFTQSYIEQVVKELSTQLERLPRADFVKGALKSSRAVVAKDLNEAMKMINFYAPEHLILSLKDPTQAASLVRNAGSVFLGYFSPESVGDYASGTNHVLPTNGFAKALSGLGLQSFMKRTTFQKLTSGGLRNIGPTVAALASAEGLDAHKNAVTIRLEDSI